MRFRTFALSLLLVAIFTSVRAQNEVRISIIAEGLFHPAGMALLPDGTVLIAEAGGHGERSAGISLLRSDGSLRRLISDLPSGSMDGNLISAPAVAVSPDGSMIILALAGAQLYSLPSDHARQALDPPLAPGDLQRRQAGRGNTFFLHPFDIAFDGADIPVVTDTAGNGLIREAENGVLRYFHRFAALDDPNYSGGRLEALPTGLARYDGSFYVTLLAGCPHVPNSGELVAVDDDGRQRRLLDGLNMPIDVAFDATGALWILEFAVLPHRSDCFGDLARQEASGRLSRINADGLLETVVENLHFPSSVLPLPDGSLYLTETYTGRLLHIEFTNEALPPQRYPPAEMPAAVYSDIKDLDRALRSVIVEHSLKPYPGQELREPDSELTRLGRDLFFDPILSGDQNIACATCHHPEFAMADGRVLPIGTGGQGLGESRSFLKLVSLGEDLAAEEAATIVNPLIGQFIPRNSPTIINSALLSNQFWDGRVELQPAQDLVRTPEDAINELHLDDALLAQTLFPITAQQEMTGMTLGSYSPMVVRSALLKRLQDNDEYASRFAAIFGEPAIDLRQLGTAIAAFERQLIFTTSPWDAYLAGDSSALNDAQKRGALLFYGALNNELNCVTCHSGDLFTDQGFHNILAPQLGPGKENGAAGNDDFGRANVSFDYRDQYRFRTPSLRNVELTAPYFHSGAYSSLADAIWHHADPWRANIVYDPTAQLPPEFHDQLLPYDFERQSHSVAPPLRAGMPMREDDVADLVAFLRSLTDPAARDLSHLLPEQVPSGLALDPLPR